MSEISKPDYTNLWSSGGANVAPSPTKIQTGWTAEVPPFQWENWSQNRQDQAIAHILQHGIAVWDNVTEYQGNKSYVTGSDGNIYRSVITNTGNNPTTDLGTNWLKQGVLPVASNAQAQALSSDTTLITPLKLFQAFKGANQLLSPTGYQKLPGGLVIQWGTGTSSSSGLVTATFPLAFPNICASVVGTAVNSSIQADAFELSFPAGTNSFQFAVVSSGPGGAAVQVATQVFWIAIGY